MEIHGGFNNCLQLAKSDENPARIGPTVAIHLTQQANSAAVWTLDVDCQIDEGFFRVGTLTTTPPSAGDPASRVVGFAYVPGARGWRVTYSCPTTTEIAELFLSSSNCCGGDFGLHANIHTNPTPENDTVNRARFVTPSPVADLANFQTTALNNDGVTAVQGDVALLVNQTVASENGPWQVGPVSGGLAPLTRPSWWQPGNAIPSGTDVHIGGEGSVYGTTVWAVMAQADTIVVDTTDPQVYPRVLKGHAALLNGTVTVTGLPIFDASSQVDVRRVVDGSPNLTVDYVVLSSGITAGTVATGQFVARAELADGSLNVADQSQIDWTLINGE